MDLERQAQQPVHEVREEIGVFEIGQKPQVHRHAEGREGAAQPFPAGAVQQPGCQVIVENHKQQQHQEHPAGLVVKEQRAGKEIGVSEQGLGVNERKAREDQRKEGPEIELGEQKGMRLVKSEQVMHKVSYEPPEIHRRE